MAEPLSVRTALGTAHGVPLREHGDPARVSLRETTPCAMFDVRVNPADAAALAEVARAAGLEVPLAANKSGSGSGRTALWLGPDQWLIVAPTDAAPQLEPALAGLRGSVTDVSDLRAAFELAGPHAADVLRKGCAIDLHPRVFEAGDCAVTALARVRVALHRPAASHSYLIYVERSYAHYLWDWLVDASSEYI